MSKPELVLTTTRLPNKLLGDLLLAGYEVFEAMAFSEILHFCEHHNISAVLILQLCVGCLGLHSNGGHLQSTCRACPPWRKNQRSGDLIRRRTNVLGLFGAKPACALAVLAVDTGMRPKSELFRAGVAPGPVGSV